MEIGIQIEDYRLSFLTMLLDNVSWTDAIRLLISAINYS